VRQEDHPEREHAGGDERHAGAGAIRGRARFGPELRPDTGDLEPVPAGHRGEVRATGRPEAMEGVQAENDGDSPAGNENGSGHERCPGKRHFARPEAGDGHRMTDSERMPQVSSHSVGPEQVTGIYTRRFRVPADAIDVNGHVNNLAYVSWMQDVAIEHSAAAGWPLERYQAIGAAWVVRSHFVEYLLPLFLGEPLAVHTWVPRFDQRAAPRKYLFVRELDRREVARAETAWVFVDLGTGKRRPLPPELLAAFHPIADDRAVRTAIGLAG